MAVQKKFLGSRRKGKNPTFIERGMKWKKLTKTLPDLAEDANKQSKNEAKKWFGTTGH